MERGSGGGEMGCPKSQEVRWFAARAHARGSAREARRAGERVCLLLAWDGGAPGVSALLVVLALQEVVA